MTTTRHLGVLDGWRGISILCVLAAHMLPLGPHGELNVAAGVLGMVIFFVLSGFLITSMLLTGIPVSDFVARRFFRVVPLAWLYLAVAMLVADPAPASWWSHFLFYANLPPQDLVPVTGHLWSLCMEVQFYVFIALWYALTGPRGLIVLPVLAVAFTGVRAWYDIYEVSITYYRIDEILAGCVLALAWHGHLGSRTLAFIKSAPPLVLIALLLVSCLNFGGVYILRPYLAALLVGTTLANNGTRLAGWLNTRALAFLASISYALYVIHPMLMHSWLGSGGLLEKYAKRPLLFIVLFALAYASTHLFESRWIALAKRMTTRGVRLTAR